MIWLDWLSQFVLVILAVYLTTQTIWKIRAHRPLFECARSVLMVGGLWVMLVLAVIQGLKH